VADWILLQSDLQLAIAEQRWETVSALSHRLMDTLLHLAAPRALAAARRMENVGRFGLLERAWPQFAALAVEIETLQRALKACRGRAVAAG
jgi:hypothetical protein